MSQARVKTIKQKASLVLSMVWSYDWNVLAL